MGKVWLLILSTIGRLASRLSFRVSKLAISVAQLADSRILRFFFCWTVGKFLIPAPSINLLCYCPEGNLCILKSHCRFIRVLSNLLGIVYNPSNSVNTGWNSSRLHLTLELVRLPVGLVKSSASFITYSGSAEIRHRCIRRMVGAITPPMGENNVLQKELIGEFDRQQA